MRQSQQTCPSSARSTNEPDDSMIECAIRALELVIPEQKGSDAW